MPTIRASVVGQLRSLGYAIAEASDGTAGLADEVMRRWGCKVFMPWPDHVGLGRERASVPQLDPVPTR
jgi:hypothetical protein